MNKPERPFFLWSESIGIKWGEEDDSSSRASG